MCIRDSICIIYNLPDALKAVAMTALRFGGNKLAVLHFVAAGRLIDNMDHEHTTLGININFDMPFFRIRDFAAGLDCIVQKISKHYAQLGDVYKRQSISLPSREWRSL